VAFRLCIYDDDREKLLNPDAWPNSVTISPWYFKNPGAGGSNNLSLARDVINDSVALAGAAAARPVARRSSGCIPDTIQSASAAMTTVASSEALPDESMMSNDETILTPVNADNDGN